MGVSVWLCNVWTIVSLLQNQMFTFWIQAKHLVTHFKTRTCLREHLFTKIISCIISRFTNYSASGKCGIFLTCWIPNREKPEGLNNHLSLCFIIIIYLFMLFYINRLLVLLNRTTRLLFLYIFSWPFISLLLSQLKCQCAMLPRGTDVALPFYGHLRGVYLC